MKKRKIIAIAGLALALSLLAAPAAGEPTATATVDIMLTILPYAEVRFDNETLDINLKGGTSGTFSAQGEIWCNCSVVLTANVYKPAGATGQWIPTTIADTIEPGVHTGLQLLTISILYETGGDFSLGLVDSSLDDPPPLEQGQATATVTVMPQ